MKPTEMMKLMVGGDVEKMYVLWFQEPGVAESVIDSQSKLMFEKLLRSAEPPEKMAARMMEMGHPVLFYENTEGGHAGAGSSAEGGKSGFGRRKFRAAPRIAGWAASYLQARDLDSSPRKPSSNRRSHDCM